MDLREAFQLGIRYARNLKEIYERFWKLDGAEELFKKRENLENIRTSYVELERIPEECLEPDNKKVLAWLKEGIKEADSKLSELEKRAYAEYEDLDSD